MGERGKYLSISWKYNRVIFMVLLSVIVPVYNVEEFIIDCLSSLVEQINFYNSELIIVNDGSEDNSLRLIYDYLEQVNKSSIGNIKIISQQNAGLSAARNVGIDVAKGKYLSFIDSDDIVLDGFYKEIYRVIDSCDVDIVKYKFKTFTKKDSMVNCDLYINLDGEYNLDYNLIVDLFNDSSWYAWAHVYRSSLFKNIRFPEQLNFEDVATIPYIYKSSKKIYFINSFLYGYRQRDGSILSSVKPEVVEKNIFSLRVILNIFLNDMSEDETFYILYIFFIRVYMSYIIKNKGVGVSYKEWREFWIKSKLFKPLSNNLFRSKKNYIYYILYCRIGFLANYMIIYIAKLYNFYRRVYS